MIMNIKIYLVVIFLINFGVMDAQIIKSHHWENRVLLILTNSTYNPTFIGQIKELKRDNDGLNERKLIIYQIQKDGYRIGLNSDSKLYNTNKLYHKFKKGDAPVEIILIGLDGGIKLRQNELLTLKELFGTIDVMPMRRREMKNPEKD